MSTTVGIDIGSEALKGVALSTDRSGKSEIVAAGMLPIGDLGTMEDSADKTLAIGVKLRELVKGARLNAPVRRVGAGGKTTSIRFLQVPPVPPWRLDMLVKYEVEEKSTDKEPAAYDYHILGIPEVSGQYTVLIGSCRESTANDLLQIGKSGGLGEVEIDLEALALYAAYYHGNGYDFDKTVLIADIGADDLTVLLCRNGELWYARTILGGGRRFTQVIVDELKIDVAEAEQVKRTDAEIIFDLQPAGASRTRVGIPGASRTGIRGVTGIIPKTDRSGVIKLDPGSSSIAATSPDDAAAITIPKPAAAAPSSSAGTAGAGAVDAPITPESLPGSDDLFMLEMPPNLEALGGAEPAAPAATAAPSTGVYAAEFAQPPADAVAAAGKDSSELSLMPVGGAATAPVAASAGPEGQGEASDANRGRPWYVALAQSRKKQISTALVREAASICAALENAVLFTKQQTKLRDLKIDRVYITGGGSKLKGLQEFMSRRMRLEVMPLEPLKQISLQRLPAEQAASLKSEQHTMAVSLGLALAHRKGTFAFQLWPAALEKKKIFWSRGAYLYYAAAMVALAVGLFLFTPYRNAQALMANKQMASDDVDKAQRSNDENNKLGKDYDEKRRRFDQIDENILSGDKFLNILAELKSRNTKDQKGRIGDDIYITSVSTRIPSFLLKLYGDSNTGAPKGPGAQLAAAKASGIADAADTFQEQRRIYIRGFAVSGNDTDMVSRIHDFHKNLVPREDQPEHSDNLFSDVYVVYIGKKQQSGTNYQQEFVLELYTAGARDEATAGGSPAARGQRSHGQRPTPPIRKN